MQYLKSIVPVALILLLGIAASAQQPDAKSPVVDDAFVQKQFGLTCKTVAGPQPMVADLDGDGIPDLVLVAHCGNPLLDEAEYKFQVVDPYNTFFGYGDTKITTQFATEDPLARGVVLLVIHGAGPEGWRAATPKAKFVIINLPFKQITVRKLMVKKKSVMAIYAEESGSDEMTSAVFWDGKKYHYQPLGSSLQ